MIVFLTLGLAVALVPATRGELVRLANAKIASGPWALVLFGFQGLLRGRFFRMSLDADASVLLWCFVCTILAVRLMKDREIPGVSLLTLGIVSNVVVVLLNGRMPVATSIAAVARDDSFYRAIVGGDILPWLGDVLPVGSSIISMGDLLMGIGVVVAVIASASPVASLDAANAQP